jgi:uncharacterized membrane protein
MYDAAGRSCAAMNTLVRNFLKGCLVIVPALGTVYVVYALFTKIDSILPLPIPGLGFAITITVITLVGAIGSNAVGRRILMLFEGLLLGVPFVRLVYSSLRDVLSVFVGQNPRFNRPVVVALGDAAGPKVLGFVTRDDLEAFGLSDHVAVYLPQAVNFSGNLLIVPRERVSPLDMSNAELMAFVVSGGVALGAEARQYTDPPSKST